MGFADIPMFLTPGQLAELTGEHSGSVQRGCVEGRIPADKVNGRWLICRDTVFSNAKEAIADGSTGIFDARQCKRAEKRAAQLESGNQLRLMKPWGRSQLRSLSRKSAVLCFVTRGDA